MLNVIFLTSDKARSNNDNQHRLPKAFKKLGCEPELLDHSEIQVNSNQLFLGNTLADHYDLIWLLGFGDESTFLDRMQLLSLARNEQLVNNPKALIFLHAKQLWSNYMPETHISNDVEKLSNIISSGGQWVCKPTAGSFGKNVSFCSHDQNPIPILEALTSAENESKPKYCIVQRYLPEIQLGELRTIIAGGALIGSYLRIPKDGLRANVSANADIRRAKPTKKQLGILGELTADLYKNGIKFAAIDLVGEHLMEVNIANPGGLESLEKLYAEDLSVNVASSIIDSLTDS
ncbi:MAG: hypothetical protein CMD74_03110 [Gammaproteobacteria bacterium]|nr:hypothetical protein [Gammaproteobacteria bacterium]|tara:strand:+ start:253 stop:1122 length:870 start_codon:yes stop_codon:yes gene_type:complete